MKAPINVVRLRTAPLIVTSIFLGLGMGGFVDGILLHQILQWHQMVSNIIPPVNLLTKNINMFWDGIFHAVTWSMTAIGIALLWDLQRRNNVVRSSRIFIGGLIFGWGLFNLIDSIFDHYLFRLHNVRENVPNPEYWNHGFFLLSLLMLGAGWLLIRKGRKYINAAA